MHAERDLNRVVAHLAAAIGDPARARMLYCLLDNRARTSTELSLVANVNASTASAHLAKLKAEGLVSQLVQGRHRFYSLSGSDVAAVLEKLSVLAGTSKTKFVSTTPDRLRAARTCYDHIAGTLGVQLHDRFHALGWIARVNGDDNSSNGVHDRRNTDANNHDSNDAYNVTAKGVAGFRSLHIDVAEVGLLRRRFAFACLDWSERRNHLGGALGAAVLTMAMSHKWFAHDGDDRALRVTAAGKRELGRRLGV